MVTERDVVRRLGRDTKNVLRRTASSIAFKPLVSAKPETEIWKAFTITLQNKIRRLPIKRGGKMIGIVKERDLLK